MDWPAGRSSNCGRSCFSQWLIKTAWEALLTPVTYAVVGFLKRREGVEVFDSGTDFSPFARSR